LIINFNRKYDVSRSLENGTVRFCHFDFQIETRKLSSQCRGSSHNLFLWLLPCFFAFLRLHFFHFFVNMPPRRHNNRSRRNTLERTLTGLRSQSSRTVGSRVDLDNLSVQGLLEVDTRPQYPVLVLGNNNRVSLDRHDLFSDSEDDDGFDDQFDNDYFDAAAAAARLLGFRFADQGGDRQRVTFADQRRRNRQPRGILHNAHRRNGRHVPRLAPAGGGPTATLQYTGAAPPVPVPVVRTSNATTLCVATDHINTSIDFYDIQHANRTVRTFGVFMGVGAATVAKLVAVWFHEVSDPQGIYRSGLQMLNDPRFAASSGALTNSFNAELLFAAATVCYTAARGPTLRNVATACVPLNNRRTCASLLNLPDGGQDAYDRALVMAATIVSHHNLPATAHQLNIDDIMEYDLYTPFHNRMLTNLRNHGIVSPNSDTVANPNDLQGVLLPMFLFLDKFYPDNVWRNCCELRKINVTTQERTLIDTQARLHNETWN